MSTRASMDVRLVSTVLFAFVDDTTQSTFETELPSKYIELVNTQQFSSSCTLDPNNSTLLANANIEEKKCARYMATMNG
jgi:hypothetical protein